MGEGGGVAALVSYGTMHWTHSVLSGYHVTPFSPCGLKQWWHHLYIIILLIFREKKGKGDIVIDPFVIVSYWYFIYLAYSNDTVMTLWYVFLVCFLHHLYIIILLISREKKGKDDIVIDPFVSVSY